MKSYDEQTLRDLIPTGTPIQKMRHTGWLFVGAALPVMWIAALWIYALYVSGALAAIGVLLILGASAWANLDKLE